MASASTFDYYRARPATRPRELLAAAPSRQLTLYGDLPGVLRNVAILMGSFAAVGEGLLLFRLYYQLVGGLPQSGPGSWLYSLGGLFVSPFRRYETAPLLDGSRALEFALLLAVEGLLVWGLLFVIGAYQGSKLASTYQPNPWVSSTYEVGPAVALWQRWDGRAEAATKAALRELKQARERFDAAVVGGRPEGASESAAAPAALSRFERELTRVQPRQSLR